jgi:hypothetical protein
MTNYLQIEVTDRPGVRRADMLQVNSARSFCFSNHLHDGRVGVFCFGMITWFITAMTSITIQS